MFWRSVVGKLAITILLLVSFVLFILSILLLEFFEGFHVQEAEKVMIQTAVKISSLVKEHDDKELVMEMVDRIKEPSSRVIIYFDDDNIWSSDTTNDYLEDTDQLLLENHADLKEVAIDGNFYNERMQVNDNNDSELIVIGQPMQEDGMIFIFQSLDVINETKAETTKIVFVAAAIAIVLTTVFAFFLSTRITSPLIQMKRASVKLAKGEFTTKLPVVTNDEIGDLARAFNKMGKDLQFNIHALRQEKEQLSSIVNSMADGVITLTRDSEIIVSNPPAKQFIEDWRFNNDLAMEAEEQLPSELKYMLDEVIQGEQEVIRELSIQGRSWVMIMTPLHDRTFVRGAVVVIRDMTEERQVDKLRKDFISNVSHELRTPISLMQGYSEAIMDDIAASTEEKNELAQIIHEESLRMSRLVNELLDISRMESGHIELNIEPVNINEFMDRIYKKFYNMAEENHIELKLTKEIESNMIKMDSDRIEQVMTNLIDNAITHTSEEGYVHIYARSTEKQLYVEVEDNGSGIPEKDLSFIFERFYKADKARTRHKQKQGTGLGLGIAKHLVNAHDGTISVKSKVDEGTAFSFKIPQT